MYWVIGTDGDERGDARCVGENPTQEDIQAAISWLSEWDEHQIVCVVATVVKEPTLKWVQGVIKPRSLCPNYEGGR